MTQERAIELATMALHRLMEIDKDSAQRFMIEEADMDKEEFEFFGVARERTAVNIDWNTDGDDDIELPEEFAIPHDIYDDDIADYLSDKTGYFVNGFAIEEED